MADRKRILIAEDENDILQILAVHLKNRGYEVFTARNGAEALQQLRENHVDLLLSDIMMPMIDGYHLAQQVHETLHDHAPKILLFTSRDISKEKNIAMMAGADEVLQKPFKMEVLETAVKRLLEL